MRDASKVLRGCWIVSAFVLAAMFTSASIPGRALADQTGWIVQFGTAAVDAAGGIAARGHDIYVSGRTGGTLPGQTSAGGLDVHVSKYNSHGELQWTRQFGTPGEDQPQGGLRARGKRVVVSGFVAGALPDQTSAGGNDAFLRACDREGGQTQGDLGGPNARGIDAFVTTHPRAKRAQ